MANNLFLDRNQFVPSLKRNAYDLYHLVNGTWSAGYIYPVDWQEVTFGDGMRTKIRAAIRTMPMVWPIQTPIIAKFYQFYVRYRTICNQYEDFRFGNKQIVHPYIALDSDADFWKTGELFDHLDGPTTYASDHDYQSLFLIAPSLGGISPKSIFPLAYSGAVSLGANLFSACSYEEGEFKRSIRFFSEITDSILEVGKITFNKILFNTVDLVNHTLILSVVNETGNLLANMSLSDVSSMFDLDGNLIIDISTGTSNIYQKSSVNTGLVGAINVMRADSLPIYQGKYFLTISDSYVSIEEGQNHLLKDNSFTQSDNRLMAYFDLGAGIFQLSEVANPFAGGHPEIPLSALVPRAYEAIYNSHFRDPINEPFVVDGEIEYNRYVTNNGVGPDYTDYKLKRRNWEADPFTSAKPSPQQGTAPIVGVTSSGDITLQRLDGGEYTVRVTTDKDGIIDGTEVTMPGQVSDFSVRRTLLDLATSGFTIERLRNANAYQQFKEAVYRRSPRYKDQALSVFGVNLRYDELDMPEFLGGFSIPLNVNIINQTSSSVEGSALGNIAGNGGFYGESNHSFQRYCDEEGIVMTLMCITPIPIYSQMLSRKWIRNTPLDYYNPQFGKIGNQPITYEEVCPVQAYNEGVDVHDVFGYQRPWYHMTSAYDTVHGHMRDTMSGFCMQRIFGSTPELGASFLHIDESQLNDCFVVQGDGQDTFYGQVAVDAKVKKPIPRSNVPSLVG